MKKQQLLNILAKKARTFKFEDAARISNLNNQSLKVMLSRMENEGLIERIEKEKILLPLEKRIIFHLYSDDYSASVLVYSIHEIMAEKMRSLFERTRARDVYDIWFISENMLDRKQDFQNAWNSSLRHQLKVLPDFELIFNEVHRYDEQN